MDFEIKTDDEILDHIVKGQKNGVGKILPHYFMTPEDDELTRCEEMCEKGLLIRLDKISGLERFPNGSYAYTSNDETGIESARLAFWELMR